MHINQRGNFPIILGILVLLLVVGGGAYYLGTQNNKQPSQQSQVINNTPAPTTLETKENPTPAQSQNGVSVKVVNGDIVVTQNGKDTKITSWGYNSDPVLSPDGSKIAYISKSKESIENEKADRGYKRTSTNVWIINSNGSNPLQITNHVNFVYRSHPHWLDNNRVLFVDGEESAKVYNTTTNILQTVLGPEEAVQACVDACGYETRYFYSPDYLYLVRLTGGGGGLAQPSKTAILNIRTLQSNQLNEEFGVDFDTVSFSDNTSLTFKGNELSNYDKQVTFNINLPSAQVTKL